MDCSRYTEKWMRERNELSRNITTQKEEWMNKCREIREITEEVNKIALKKNLEIIKDTRIQESIEAGEGTNGSWWRQLW